MRNCVVMPLALVAVVLAGSPVEVSGQGRELSTDYQELELVEIVGGLEHPWSVVPLPGGDLLVTERPGRIQRVSGGAAHPVSGVPEVHAERQGGLLDLAVHPDHESNGLAYLTYSKGDAESTVLAVARGRLDGFELLDLEDIFVSNSAAPPGGHYGGRILFLDDGTFLVSIGDRNQDERAQDTSDHAGTIVRLDEDGGVPADNPFVGRDSHAPEIFTYGHRNVQGLVRDPVTGQIWATEHGPRGGDELNLLRPGANYGWPTVSRGREYLTQRQAGVARTLPGKVDPVFVFLPTLAPSGLAVVGGGGFHRTWHGNLLAGGLGSERLLRIVLEDLEVVYVEDILNGEIGRIRDVRQGPEGAIYVATDAPEGGVYRLAPPPGWETNLLALLSDDPRFGTLLRVLEHTGIDRVINSTQPFTIFAPTDDAFDALPPGYLDELMDEPQRLLPLLARHIMPGKHELAALLELGEATTVSGVSLPVRAGEAGVEVGGARVIAADVLGSNGAIHMVDMLLLEET